MAGTRAHLGVTVPEPVSATRAALEVINDLEAAHGPLAFFQSAGCCAGTAPVCLRAGELPAGPGDRLLGSVAGAPFYMDAELYERWGRPRLEIDVAPGAADTFSLEGLADLHFVTRTPAASCDSDAMPTEPRPVSLAQVVRRAAQIVDPDDEDAAVGDFQLAFEDDDEPVRGIGDVEALVSDVLARLDPAVANGSLAMAGAITVYLSYRRDELHGHPSEIIKLAARSEWEKEPPEVVREWLDDRGVRL